MADRRGEFTAFEAEAQRYAEAMRRRAAVHHYTQEFRKSPGAIVRAIEVSTVWADPGENQLVASVLALEIDHNADDMLERVKARADRVAKTALDAVLKALREEWAGRYEILLVPSSPGPAATVAGGPIPAGDTGARPNKPTLETI